MTTIEAISILKDYSLVLDGKMIRNPSNQEVVKAIKKQTKKQKLNSLKPLTE